MPNTINLRLLDNKNIIAELNGIPLAQENSYKIIAGEENATNFKIASKPNQYINARYTVEMVNSQGFGVDETDIIEDTFSLPIGMAVAGYGYMQIRAYKGVEVIPFMTLKIKVWNTLPNWKDHISEGGASVNITIDTELSDTSTNPVQNKVISKELTKIKNFEHPKTYIGLDYPNIQGVQGGEFWTITFPKYTGWTWKDRSIEVQEDITLTLSIRDIGEKRLKLAYIFLKESSIKNNPSDWMEYITSADDFMITTQGQVPVVNATQYRFIGVAKLPIYEGNTYSSIPHLDMGGLPFRWNGQIVENIEIDKKIGDIDKALDELHAYAENLVRGN